MPAGGRHGGSLCCENFEAAGVNGKLRALFAQMEGVVPVCYSAIRQLDLRYEKYGSEKGATLQTGSPTKRRVWRERTETHQNGKRINVTVPVCIAMKLPVACFSQGGS
jgi:hypothetical protein